MIFAHTNMIQEGESALFYRYSTVLKGYMIAGMLIAPNVKAKISFKKLWTYFVSEIVRADDIYSSIIVGSENSMITKYLTYHSTIKDIKIYKVDNFIRDKYSSYAMHIKRTETDKNL